MSPIADQRRASSFSSVAQSCSRAGARAPAGAVVGSTGGQCWVGAGWIPERVQQRSIRGRFGVDARSMRSTRGGFLVDPGSIWGRPGVGLERYGVDPGSARSIQSRHSLDGGPIGVRSAVDVRSIQGRPGAHPDSGCAHARTLRRVAEGNILQTSKKDMLASTIFFHSSAPSAVAIFCRAFFSAALVAKRARSAQKDFVGRPKRSSISVKICLGARRAAINRRRAVPTSLGHVLGGSSNTASS